MEEHNEENTQDEVLLNPATHENMDDGFDMDFGLGKSKNSDNGFDMGLDLGLDF